ncbi:hypothetical protein SAMN03159338_2249 [Sphingomonas sp. NFR04]|uniref:hypothetical protein n=1 Tax=Sphingomonas sp. NFR04 TaxID=1566283 RepID=UPI0008F2C740|nr:hypothetical protein [Sphingomonas sp. NFR04]SFJ70593.1 hypothetical protein SAMN03159338_2249 [Sphingomonas sp. NFR04]
MGGDDEDLGFGAWAFAALILLVALFAASVTASQATGSTGAIGICGLIFLSAATAGALVGFIFAVPRVLSNKRETSQVEGVRARVLGTNTNLERISDWLSTMLVGVGLSQLTNFNGLLVQFRFFLAETAKVYMVAGRPSAGVIPAVGPFVLVLGAASGFLFMYLMTRLVLVGFFKESEEMLSGRAAAAIRVAVREARDDAASAVLAADASADASKAGPLPAGEAQPSEQTPSLQDSVTAATFEHAATARTLTADDALEVMFELLYEPRGYLRVIQMSAELSRSSITRRAEYWFYLAAAFGQKMHNTLEGSNERQSARDNALDAARRAVKIDKAYRSRLWAISDPESTDDDLALLRDDAEFRRLVGK